MRSVFFHTFGCQMNVHDTRRIAEQLHRRGFQSTQKAADADLIVVNTCSVRELAVQKALSELGRLADHKRDRGAKIAVAGCAAQLQGAKMLRKYPAIDLVLGPDNIYQVGDLVERVFAGERLVSAELDESPGFQFLSAASAPAVSALVTVQKGCDKNCSYCIVPRVRGREVSRPLADIVEEVEMLVASGVREVTLLGQNIDAYRDFAGARFDTLLRAVGTVPGLWRLRFTTGHPNDFTLAMAQAMAETEAVCEHLHLPAQSGSDAVLRRMYRGYTAERYLQKIAAVRAVIPDVSITTDLIVGFPGETESDFQATLDLVERAQFDAAFSFTYSVRPGTKAQAWPDDVPNPEKKERLDRLLEVIRRVAKAKAQRFVGRVMEVLVEGPSKTDASHLTGRIRHNTIVNFGSVNFGSVNFGSVNFGSVNFGSVNTAGEVAPGELAPVEIAAAPSGFALVGRLAEPTQRAA